MPYWENFLLPKQDYSNRQMDCSGKVLRRLIPESCTKYRSEAPKALCLKGSWSDFDPQAYNLYGEDQNHETSFKHKDASSRSRWLVQDSGNT